MPVLTAHRSARSVVSLRANPRARRLIVRTHPIDLEEPDFEGTASLPKAIRQLEQSTLACRRIVLTQPGKRAKEQQVVQAIIQICRNCRSAFSRWDIEETLFGDSEHRERLERALRKSEATIESAIEGLRPSKLSKTLRAYLENIHWRIRLFNIGITRSWKTYERAKETFLTQALARRVRR
ncbi:MAG: hypothetical protein HY301_10460 [Verrucomicrobia bacterium]|nr:hypothetical protein [Verrucomicrobiota bacterium]